MCGRITQHYTWKEIHDLYELTAPKRGLLDAEFLFSARCAALTKIERHTHFN
jgi:hypothetical protein